MEFVDCRCPSAVSFVCPLIRKRGTHENWPFALMVARFLTRHVRTSCTSMLFASEGTPPPLIPSGRLTHTCHRNADVSPRLPALSLTDNSSTSPWISQAIRHLRQRDPVMAPRGISKERLNARSSHIKPRRVSCSCKSLMFTDFPHSAQSVPREHAHSGYLQLSNQVSVKMLCHRCGGKDTGR